MITAEKLTFGFDDTFLLREVSFTLERNCHCALIGSNGTGKTTLANLIRQPDNYDFTGKLRLEDVGRIGHVSQFATRQGDQDVTVFDYLSADFLQLQEEMARVCAQMETAENLDALMERYQALLDESDSLDADNYESNIRRQLQLAELVDIDRSHISAIELGNVGVSFDVIFKLCEVLEVTPKELFDFRD